MSDALQVDHDLVNWKFKFTEEAKSISSRLEETVKGKAKYLEQENYVDYLSNYARQFKVDEVKFAETKDKLETVENLILNQINEQIENVKNNASLGSIIDCILDLQFIHKDSEENKKKAEDYNNDYIEKTSNSVIGLKMDLKRQLNGIFGLLQSHYKIKEESQYALKNAIFRIIDEPYLKAWKQDFVCTLAKLKNFDHQIKEMADGYGHIAAELIDAIQNDTLDGFIGFNYEGERNKESAEKLKKDDERLQQLIEMLQTVKKKIELPAEENKVDVDKFMSDFNKLYKNKSKYIWIQKDDKKKLEKYKELKKLEEIISENVKENYDVLTKAFIDLHKEEENQKKKNLRTIEYKGSTIIIRNNDLTEEMTQAIVNPENEQLMHEGEYARSIADKAGDKFKEECKEYIRKNGKLLIGSAMLTSAGGSLCCDKVIHTVGPKYNKNLPDNSLAHDHLKMCTNNIMDIIKSENIKSVSIPAVSTGIFGFPIHKCADIMGSTIKSYIDSNPEIHNREIVFCNFDDETTNIFLRVIPDRFLEQNVESDGDENKSSGDDEDSRDNSKKKKKSRGKKDSEEEEDDEDQTEEIIEKKRKRNNKKSEEVDEEDDTVELKTSMNSMRNKKDRDDDNENENNDEKKDQEQTEEVKKE